MEITNFIYPRRESALQLGDHGSYGTQLSRQLAATRKRLGRSTPKNTKYQKKEPISAEQIGGNVEFAHLILLTCERAWAHAMLLKAARAEDNAGKGFSASSRSHIVSRLNRATKEAGGLAHLLSQKSSGASDTDWLEAIGYAHTMAGAEEFEKHASSARASDTDAQRARWEPCLVKFATARVIYAALLKSRKHDVYKDVIAGVIDPSMRYAAYQSHIPRTVPVVSVARRFFPRDDGRLIQVVEQLDEGLLKGEKESTGKFADASIPNTIVWRKRSANIVDASIGQALATVATAQDDLNSFMQSATAETTAQEKAAAYDEVLIASQDTADATRRAIDEHKKEGVSEGDPRMQDLRITNLATNYDLVGWRVGRNRILIGDDDGVELRNIPLRKPKRPRKDGTEWLGKEEGTGRKLARLRVYGVLYDSILQSVDSIKELPGAAEPGFQEELDGKREYFQALKCLNIAYSYALLSNSKKALALLLRAETLSSSALAKPLSAPTSLAPMPKLDITPQSMQTLHTKLQNLVNHYRGLVELSNLNDNAAAAGQKHTASAAPIIDRLNEYPPAGVDVKNLVTYPPKLKPVPVKPLFLDLAWNYIEYPGRAAAANGEAAAPAQAATTEAPTEQKKGGWGWFSRS